MKRFVSIVALLVSSASLSAAQKPQPAKRAIVAAKPAAVEPKFKAIWEPVNYPTRPAGLNSAGEDFPHCFRGFFGI